MPSIPQELERLRTHSQPLQVVAHQAVRLAGLDASQASLAHLGMAYFKVIDAVENEGGRLAQLGQELAYHNRAHVADAITALACLLSASAEISEADKWLSLIAMAGHDFGHQGKSNQQLGLSQENLTAEWLQSQLASCLSAQDMCRITTWVVGTDPDLVEANHLAYAASPKDEDLHLQVLINEADIAASLMPELALGLTRQLLRERGLDASDDARVRDLYQAFSKFARFSSPAAKRLFAHPGVSAGSAASGPDSHRIFSASYSASVTAVGQARAEFMQALAAQPMAALARLDVEIALGEVLQNIVRHADFSQSPVWKFDIQADRLGTNLKVQVMDSAKPIGDLGFLTQQHQTNEEGGMGIALIFKITNKYEIVPINGGNMHHLYFLNVFE